MEKVIAKWEGFERINFKFDWLQEDTEENIMTYSLNLEFLMLLWIIRYYVNIFLFSYIQTNRGNFVLRIYIVNWQLYLKLYLHDNIKNEYVLRAICESFIIYFCLLLYVSFFSILF